MGDRIGLHARGPECPNALGGLVQRTEPICRTGALRRSTPRIRSGPFGAAGTLIWGPRRRWGWRRCRAGGRVCASAVAKGELAVLEVAEELVPLGVGRW